MEELKLMFIDLDSTLTARNQQLDLEWLNKIIRLNPELKENNIYLTIATSKPASYAESILQTINGEVPAVCENGSIIYTPINSMVLKNNLVPKKFDKTISKIESLIEKKLGNDYIKQSGREASISLIPKRKTTITAYDEIRKLLRKFDVNIIYSETTIDIQAIGITKMSGIEQIIRKLGLDMDNTACISDSINDYTMLEKIGYPCCTNNAKDKIKKLVTDRNGYISKNDYTQGVYYCIKKYSFIKA